MQQGIQTKGSRPETLPRIAFETCRLRMHEMQENV